ncbi:hypothetical protein DEM27_33040 [Metarhizobium album]|uniref:Uncharacterized protein n=1 Tax=Metarhizobium album TaxID=2182425 RepID=A0A2U2DFJ0_9HYPH|nr:hypothetical protein [Rhizobium album]PWE52044.1 hypothetical protein DEM27_33040 [Rhizobium album]
MSSIYLDGNCRLSSYGAKITGAKAVVTIHIHVNDHAALGFLLRELEEIRAAQMAPPASAKRSAKAKPMLALPKPPLQLPFLGDVE